MHDALGDDERERLLELTRAVLSRPTAPYAEDLQVRGVLAFAAERPGLRARLDVHGNVIVAWDGASGAASARRADVGVAAGANDASSRTRAARAALGASLAQANDPSRIERSRARDAREARSAPDARDESAARDTRATPNAAALHVAHARDGASSRRADRRGAMSMRAPRELDAADDAARGAHAAARAPLVYSAHLDHPGLLYDGRRGGAHVATLHGGVPLAYLPGAPVRFFALDDGAALATARVAKAERDRAGRVRVELDAWIGRAPRGTPGMWDLTPGAIRGDKLHARVCDDLLGAVAILHVLDRLWRARSPVALSGVFTRAEETGFVGCLGLLRTRELAADACVIGLECSPRRATAQPGRGPVVRVGDAASVFDPSLSRALHANAIQLREGVAGFAFQRALMDGGRCESTAYNAYGIRSGAACLALGNYHNCGARGARSAGRIAPEWVAWSDHEGLCALLHAFAHSWNERTADAQALRSLDALWRRESPRLAVSAARVSRAARAQLAAGTPAPGS